MEVKLPRSATGQEVVDAFKKAVNTADLPGVRFTLNEHINELAYEPGSVKQVIKSVSVKASIYIKKTFKRLFGLGTRDEFQGGYYFELRDIDPADSYQKVEIACIDGTGSIEDITADLEMLGSEGLFRPHFEALLEKFYAELQPKAA